MSFCLSSSLKPSPSTSLNSDFTVRALTLAGRSGCASGGGGRGKEGEGEREREKGGGGRESEIRNHKFKNVTKTV